ncbi:MAG: MBL fold metallo-hydrolase [Deltaproteobacteria bacterium]|nr:MBL fold metallo-hydrolase [Deltaproteobacteria bacterium]
MRRPVKLMKVVLPILLTAFILVGGTSFSNPVTHEDIMIKDKNYSNGKFQNYESTTVLKSGTYGNTIYKYLFGGSKERAPSLPLPVVSMNISAHEPASDGLRFFWLGHSGVLLELGGKRVLIDPVFSERASFSQWTGPKRFQPSPLQAQDVHSLYAVLISHDHYDHLDKATIIALAPKTESFHVPLGVGAIMERWGIPKTKIHEYAWWGEYNFKGMTFVATPARHFSGRGIFDRYRTLWCSWVVIQGGKKIFHSGDTGMTSQFHEIGAKYGPFDLAFIKIAAYDENWPDIHLTPEEAVAANQVLGGRTLVPIHWGVFDLALHSWHEPIERLVKSAQLNKMHILVPKMGELVDPDKYENDYWWRKFMNDGKNVSF